MHGIFSVDTPDPYVRLFIKTAPEGRRQTKVKDNETNPKWNEEFEFLLNEHEENVLGEIKIWQLKTEFFLNERNKNHNKKIGL